MSFPDDRHAQHRADRSLVERAVKGEMEAQQELVERLRCVPRILAARNKRLATPLGEEDLRDLAQETIVRVWRKLGTFDGRAALETWVYRFCFLELMNAVRRQARQPRSEEASLVDLPSALEAEPAEGGVLTLLRHLSAREHEVVRLRHLEHLGSLREVAQVLNLSLSSVKTHYYRALEKLRDLARRSELASMENQSDG